MGSCVYCGAAQRLQNYFPLSLFLITSVSTVIFMIGRCMQTARPEYDLKHWAGIHCACKFTQNYSQTVRNVRHIVVSCKPQHLAFALCFTYQSQVLITVFNEERVRQIGTELCFSFSFISSSAPPCFLLKRALSGKHCDLEGAVGLLLEYKVVPLQMPCHSTDLKPQTRIS